MSHQATLPITPEYVGNLLANSHNKILRQWTASALIWEVCGHFNMTIAELKTRGKTHRVVFPRQIAAYLLRQHTRLSFPAIGRRLGLSHWAVMYAVQRIEEMRTVSQELDELLRKLEGCGE